MAHQPYALLMGCPVLEQSPQHLRVLHPIAGLTLIELKEGKPARASNPLFNQPKLSHLVKGFPIRIVHSAFSLPPVEVLMEMSVSPLLAQVPSFFDQYEIGSSGQSRVVEFKSKQSDRMPLDLIRKGLALDVSRTWRDTLLEQLLGTREEPEPFEILGSEEPQPIKSHPSNHGSCQDWWLRWDVKFTQQLPKLFFPRTSQFVRIFVPIHFPQEYRSTTLSKCPWQHSFLN